MIVERLFYNVRCDCCGDILDKEFWHEDKDTLGVSSEGRWIKVGERHYCQNCYTRDDEDNLVVTRKFSEDEYEHFY